ncbi:MAG: hypothetical protein JRF22_04440 [Deltaproteobacteria bacterium]|nr:hypothetical protein [Deltaproteobacteria bacterium]
MEKVEGKEMPWEKQREILIEAAALKLPLLYQTLIEAYGEEKGKRVYDELFEIKKKKRAAQFKDKEIGDIMMAEIGYFPAMG